MHYFVMNMDWDYDSRRVHGLMLNNVPKALTQFQQQTPNKPQHQPYPIRQTQLLSKGAVCVRHGHVKTAPQVRQKIIQEVFGTFLYYAQCVDSIMLAALGSIAIQQANLTENTMKKVQQYLD
jgi:hypothetical protein